MRRTFETASEEHFDRENGDLIRQTTKDLTLTWEMARTVLMAANPTPTPGPVPKSSIGIAIGTAKAAAVKTIATKHYSSRTKAQALALAQANNWDVIIPQGDELFLDFDDFDSYQRYVKARKTFESSIAPIVEEVVQVSKSGDPNRCHVYLRLDIDSMFGSLTVEQRITYQLMLQSDPVREMLSWARHQDGEPHATLFFELPGICPKGFGKVLQSASPQPAIALPVAVPPGTGGSSIPTINGGMGAGGTMVGAGGIVFPIWPQPSAPQPAPGTIVQVQPSVSPNPADYPHKCPKCGGPSYNGLFNFDCMKGCRP